MIALIGIMVGAYAMARCASLAGDKQEGVLVKTLATVAFLINLCGIVVLALSGLKA